MRTICPYFASLYRRVTVAAGYGLMNMTGVFAGAFITQWLGKSTDAGNLGRDMALLAIPVIAAIILLFVTLKPEAADKTAD